MILGGSESLALTKGDALAVESVFSTYVYEGNDTVNAVNTGIDLINNDGLVWLKNRDDAANHVLIDTVRTNDSMLASNTAYAENTGYSPYFSFTDTGFDLDYSDDTMNDSAYDYVSWTFRKAPRFFDVIKYTGNGVAGREIPHELGCDVGMMIIKPTNATDEWIVWHKSKGALFYGLLNGTNTFDPVTTTFFNGTNPTDSVFTVDNHPNVNSTKEYIAYLFADDPLGEAGDGSGMIACGSYVGNGLVDGPEIDLGWEPQYVMIKAASTTGSWQIFDCIRGIVAGEADSLLRADTTEIEAATTDWVDITPLGFSPSIEWSYINGSGDTYIYMAIRRPDTKTVESSSEVFAIDTAGSTGDGEAPAFRGEFPIDMGMHRLLTAADTNIQDRLTQGTYLKTNLTTAKAAHTNRMFDYMDGYLDYTSTNASLYAWMFKRAYSFFDCVTYEGDGVAGRTVPHNLGVVPEMMWVKGRSNGSGWLVYDKTNTALNYMGLNTDASSLPYSTSWDDTEPTSEVLTLGSSTWSNANTETFVAYLFATLPKISSVFSYTGNASATVDIDMGFTTGLKFIIVKRTDNTGDWVMCDVSRGLDNFLILNDTDAQASGSGIATLTNGARITQNATTNLNVDTATYIGYGVSN